MAILCKVTRGEFTESIHVVFAVVVDESGDIIYSTGDPHYLTCIRSSLKPFQAAAAIREGSVDAAGFTDDEIACGLICRWMSTTFTITHIKSQFIKHIFYGLCMNIFSQV